MAWRNLLQWLLLVQLIVLARTAYQSVTNPRIIEHPEDQYVTKNEPATLNCKAEGDPHPVITWYRNGQPVITANENPSSHRMLLPSGQLFFLRIIHNKNNKPDIGVYHCVATNPQTKVSVHSHNATLEIAVLRDDFRQNPKNTEVAIGDTAILECRPPKGSPEPRVSWKNSGETIHPHGRITIEENGNLMIQDARKEDSGSYVCMAFNKAGEKDSSPASLLVKEKPKFSKSPQDILVQENVDVEFQCQAHGDPSPTIIWKREEGQIPQGRSHILDDRSLKIERVKVSDEGMYICRAENSVGYVEAFARLSVHSHPTFIVTPQDKVVGMGRTVSLRCEVTGNPPPAVFWNKETSQILMFPRQDHGRFSVTDEGTLIIEPVKKEDAGEYVCQALSVAGSAFAKARIGVKDVDPRPPPIIHQGPQNQTLPVNSVAMLQCHSSGDPPPTIRWYRNNRPLSMRDARIAVLDSGTLQISDLRQSDTGMYTCKATSETGDTMWSASLTVEAPTNPSVIFHRTPEPSTFPGPPSKPIISEITETSMKLTWKSNSNHGASPIIEYLVEYFSHETGEGWVVASDSIKGQSFVIHNLRPDTSYMFLVRARNSHGTSLPSQVAGPFRTAGGNGAKPTLAQFDIALVSQKLTGQVVHMKQPEILSSTAVKLNWEILKSHRFIEGYHIKYRVMPDIYEHMSHNGHHHHHVEYTIETVDSGTATMYVLRNLMKFTWYEIRVQPFYLTVEGQESNIVRVRTFEDVPSAPPQNIVAQQLDNNTLHLSWSPPPQEYHNGPLRGYKVFFIGNESKFHRNITVNASTHSIVVSHLVKGMPYRLQMAAYNRMGVGVRSDPYIVGGESAQGLIQGFVKEPWFIATLIGTIGGTLWLALCVFSIWLYRKKKARKKMHKNGVMTVPVHKTDDPSRAEHLANHVPLLSAHLQSGASSSADGLQPDVTNVSEQRSKEEQMKENLYNTPNVPAPPMKTFYNKNAMPVAPYATTTLITNNILNKQPSSEGSAFRPIQKGSPYIQQGSGSSDSCLKPDMSSESNTDNSRPNTDDDPINRIPGGPPGGFPMLFLPPPPEHPPPSDIGTPPDSPTDNRRHMSRGMSDRESNSPYAQLPARQQQYMHGSEHNTPVTESPYHQVPYSDSEYQSVNNGNRCFSPRALQEGRTHSLRGPHHGERSQSPPNIPPQCRTMSPRAHIDLRAYSPRCMSEPERGPTPPVRAYKLVPLNDHPHHPHELQRHYSDTEGAPVPPLRMLSSHNPPSPAPDDPMMDRGIQSSLPSLANECMMNPTARLEHSEDGPLLHLGGSQDSEEVIPDYGDDFDLDNVMLRQDCPSPDSSIGDLDPNVTGNCELWENVLPPHGDMVMPTHVADDQGSMLASWASITDNSDTNCSSNRSSALSSSDGSFFAEADFASAVAKAAELSGLTVVGSTVIDPNAGRERPKIRKSAKHRSERAKRPTSPYSTDSNYSTVQVPHRPYPKSERKRQLQEQATKYGGVGLSPPMRNGNHPPPGQKPKPAVRNKPRVPQQGSPQNNGEEDVPDVPSYNKPNFPSPSGNGNGFGMNGNNNVNKQNGEVQRSAASTPKTPTHPNGLIEPVMRGNPITMAFDTTDTPIV